MTKIQIKRISKKVLIPKYETPGSSGMDIAAYIEKNIIWFIILKDLFK